MWTRQTWRPAAAMILPIRRTWANWPIIGSILFTTSRTPANMPRKFLPASCLQAAPSGPPRRMMSTTLPVVPAMTSTMSGSPLPATRPDSMSWILRARVKMITPHGCLYLPPADPAKSLAINPATEHRYSTQLHKRHTICVFQESIDKPVIISFRLIMSARSNR